MDIMTEKKIFVNLGATVDGGIVILASHKFPLEHMIIWSKIQVIINLLPQENCYTISIMWQFQFKHFLKMYV